MTVIDGDRKSPDPLDDGQVVAATRHWVESLVVGYNLCPFARRELVKNRVRFVVSHAQSEQRLVQTLQAELELLDHDPDVETTLLIHPGVLQDFNDYNQFLAYAENLLVVMGWEGIYQIASFHPDYQFVGTAADDVENYTNRAPYPMLHLIREASLERAIADYPDVEMIPQRNIDLMNALGREKLQSILLDSLEHASDDSRQSESPPRRSPG